jgi:hypothetical protein
LIVRGEKRIKQPPLVPDPLRQSRLEGAIDRFLGHEDRRKRHGGDRRSRLQRLGKKIGGRNDPRHEAGAFRLLGPHHPAGEHQIHRLGLADRARQPLGAARAGNDAKLDLRLTESRGVRRQDEIAHHCELTAAAERKACDGGDDRLSRTRHRVPAADKVVEEGVDETLIAHLLDVGARRKSLLGACQHYAADAVIRFKV